MYLCILASISLLSRQCLTSASRAEFFQEMADIPVVIDPPGQAAVRAVKKAGDGLWDIMDVSRMMPVSLRGRCVVLAAHP